jgi:lipopolysaccharide transport system ATP-binding protein
MSDAIIVEKLGKRLRRQRENRALTLQEALVKGLLWKKGDETFWALKDVSFTVGQGKSLGVIGKNGAGKSTLLRLIGGIGRAEEGRVSVRGRIGALLDLGAGFHPDLTGRENLFVNGAISGLTRREINGRFSDIVDFAELADFIDSPLRTYSSGMQLRLAFAIAVHTDPEVLIIDEVLAVGDLAFQQKCMDRIDRFKEAGCTIVVVSHDPGLVERFCDKALWLQEGLVAAYGPAAQVVAGYEESAQREIERNRIHEWEHEHEQGHVGGISAMPERVPTTPYA